MAKPRRAPERAKTDKSEPAEKPKAKARLLVAEDEASLRDILRFQLQSVGYEVYEAVDGKEALEKVSALQPDLVLLDVMMPQVDGYDVCRKLRASFLTRHIPIIMLTAKTTKSDKQTGLEGGANDYVTKPWDAKELQLRVRNVLEWSRQQRSASPLTGLPGNLTINEEVRRRIENSTPFAMLQIDIDFFKSFNDRYGYQRGDDAIQTVARILIRAAQEFSAEHSFVGHIGGDDFVVLTRPDDSESTAEFIINEFNQTVPGLYDPEDQERGWIEVRNRSHQMDEFPMMSLTVALVSTDSVSITHLAQLIDIAQELKEHGKGIPGSVVVGERRRPGDGHQSVA